jgi:hypothetical protein
MTTVTSIDLRAAYFCAAEFVRHNPTRATPRIRNHLAHLDELMRMSSPRQENSETRCGEPQSKQALIGADEVAELLGCHVRTVQRRGEELGGRRIGSDGPWVFDRAMVIERRDAA